MSKLPDCYILCATPRTGSTLLCQYLTSTGVAGTPHSYFRKEDMQAWAEGWNVVKPNEAYDAYLAGMQQATASSNGVLGIRIMWESLDELTEALGQLYPNLKHDSLALLQKAFGNLKFIYLYREDMIAQAISLYRAEQTGYWHTVEGSEPEQDPDFDFKAIKANIEEAEEHNKAWEDWFEVSGINVLKIGYEELSYNPQDITKQVLQFLDIDLPSDIKLNAPNQRLADELSIEWKERFIRIRST